jgi:hypothetical protein
MLTSAAHDGAMTRCSFSPPPGVPTADRTVDELTAGQVVSGHVAVSSTPPTDPGARRNTVVLVLTRRDDAALRFATTWFLWSAAAVVVLGVARPAHALARRSAAHQLPDSPVRWR